MLMPAAGHSVRHRRRAAGLVAAIAMAMAAAAAGCGYSNPAPVVNIAVDTLVAFAMNGSPAAEPSGFDLFSQSMFTIDANLSFDVAFDVDSATRRAVVYPVALVSNGFITTRHVGLQRIDIPYDSATYGLRTGYVFDSAYTLAPGQALYVVTNPVACEADANPSLYGKLVVDSVNTLDRTIHFRATVDPNCGFRDFKPGIPVF
jgi:hypothetical protein